MLGVGLTQIANVLTKFESRNLKVDPQQCTKLRHRKSRCKRCIDQCPEQAITIQTTIQVNPDRCTSCGICASVCPTGALEASNPNNAELLSRIEQRKNSVTIAFACSRAIKRADERVVQVNCLGRLDESLVVGAASRGIEQILLVDGPCEACANAIGRSVAGKVVAEANALIQATGISLRVRFVPELESPVNIQTAPSSSANAVSRRAFLTMFTRDAKAAAALTVSSVLETEKEMKPESQKGKLPQRISTKRELMLESLKRIERTAKPDFRSQRRMWATCHIKDNCTGCQMCVFFCPTGALSKIEEEGKRGLAFRLARCSGCGLCQEICFWHAIELSDTIDLVGALKDSSDTFLFSPETSIPHTPEEKLGRLLNSLK